MDKYIDTQDFNLTNTLEVSKTIQQYLVEKETQHNDFIDALSNLLINSLNNKSSEE